MSSPRRVSLGASLLLLALVAPATAMAACDSSRATYMANATLTNAAQHIDCLEGALASGGGTGPVTLPWVPEATPFGSPRPIGPAYRELQQYLEWMHAQYQWADDAWLRGVAPTLPADAKVLLARPEDDQIRWMQLQDDQTWTEFMVVTPERVDIAPELVRPDIMLQHNQVVAPDFGGFDAGGAIGGGAGGM